MHTDSARLAPNRTLSRHLPTIIINVVPCYTHLRVHFGIETHAQLALSDEICMLLPFRSSVENLLRGPLLVGKVAARARHCWQREWKVTCFPTFPPQQCHYNPWLRWERQERERDKWSLWEHLCCRCCEGGAHKVGEHQVSELSVFPTNNALLVNFFLSSDADVSLISTDWACKSAPNVQKRACNARACILTKPPLCMCNRWWLGCQSPSTVALR